MRNIKNIIIILICILSGCMGGRKAKIQRDLDDLQNQIFDIQQDYVFIKNRLLRQSDDIKDLQEEINLFKNQGNDLVVKPIKKEDKKVTVEQKMSTNQIDLYKMSKDFFFKGEIEKAIASFTEYLELYPDTSYTDNAQYWIGECYYKYKNFKRAAEEFNKVITQYPAGNKVPAALLKAGYCYYELKDYEKSLEVLQKLITKKTDKRIYTKAQKKIDQILSVR
ncbi:MAG: tol-pal system protein YbgF [bacterium]